MPVQDWAEIRYVYSNEGLSERAIATRLGIARDTVSRAIASTGTFRDAACAARRCEAYALRSYSRPSQSVGSAGGCTIRIC